MNFSFRRLILTSILVNVSLFAVALTVGDSTKVTFKLNGFVNSQIFYDTRQIVESREHMLSFYPKPASFDADGNDLYAVGNLNQLSMTSRLRLNINGPKILGARAKALIEGDFTGASNFENNSFRLREAYLQLHWEHFSLLAGQTWHPLNVPDCRPSLLGLNTGAPFHPFSRHNQIRLEYRVKKITLMAVAASQRDFASSGPLGVSSVYLQNAQLPNLNLQLKYADRGFLLGATIDYKRLKPALYNIFQTERYQNKNMVSSWSGNIFASYSNKGWHIKTSALYGQNLTEHLMLGGYYESLVDLELYTIEYKSTGIVSSWIQAQKQINKWKFSLFGAYTAQLSYPEMQEGEFFGRGQDIAAVYRISPAVTLRLGAFELGTEIEYTNATYGTPGNTGKITGKKSYGNTRMLIGASYFF